VVPWRHEATAPCRPPSAPKGRPNRLDVSVCRLLAVNGLILTVQALDAIDGTPVLDLKPYMTEFGPRGQVRQPAWSHELMAGYWNTQLHRRNLIKCHPARHPQSGRLRSHT